MSKTKGGLTFKKVSKEWLKYYKTTVKDTTFSRVMSDYVRFIPKFKFKDKAINKISAFDIKVYLQETILKDRLKLRVFSNLKTLLNGIFKYALDKKYITENPIDNLTVSTANIVQSKRKTKEEEVFINKEEDKK